MNLDDIKRISIREFLGAMGITPKTEKPGCGMYFSPLREERTASFKVDYDLNLWCDHGTGEGGDIIRFVMRLENCTFPESLERLQGTTAGLSVPTIVPTNRPTSQPPAIEITEVRPLENHALRQYLQSRQIDLSIAERYCKEVHFRMNGKPYYAIGFKNDAGGWKLRNEWFKGSSTPKNITTFPNGSDTVMVFEGFIDFLSYLSLKDNPAPSIDTAVLNSVANLRKATPFLESHRTIHAFLDNDDAGRKSLACLRESLPASEVVDQSPFYRDYKDLNEYWCEKSNPKNQVVETKAAVQIKRQIPVQKKGGGRKL
jgi:DNA primase